MPKTLPEIVVAARRRAGLTQDDVAAHFGVDRSSVSHWETGRVTPSLQVLQGLSVLLKFTTEERLAILPGDESPAGPEAASDAA